MITCVPEPDTWLMPRPIFASSSDDTQELLEIMVTGKRLKDIADLPLDLAI